MKIPKSSENSEHEEKRRKEGREEGNMQHIMVKPLNTKK